MLSSKINLLTISLIVSPSSCFFQTLGEVSKVNKEMDISIIKGQAKKKKKKKKKKYGSVSHQ